EGHHRARAGIAVRLRHIMVHDKGHLTAPGAVARTEHVLTVGVMRLQLTRPALAQLFLVRDLISLHPAGRVGSVGDALEMDDGREWRVVHLAPGLADLERQVRILAVRGTVMLVEAAEGTEQG